MEAGLYIVQFDTRIEISLTSIPIPSLIYDIFFFLKLTRCLFGVLTEKDTFCFLIFPKHFIPSPNRYPLRNVVLCIIYTPESRSPTLCWTRLALRLTPRRPSTLEQRTRGVPRPSIPSSSASQQFKIRFVLAVVVTLLDRYYWAR